jgi:septal ring factor EnvC (AmiA/AmiB activator)
MEDINDLRRKRRNASRHEASLVETIKNMDADQRKVRKELDTTRKELRQLDSQIRKLAKEEEEL